MGVLRTVASVHRLDGRRDATSFKPCRKQIYVYHSVWVSTAGECIQDVNKFLCSIAVRTRIRNSTVESWTEVWKCIVKTFIYCFSICIVNEDSLFLLPSPLSWPRCTPPFPRPHHCAGQLPDARVSQCLQSHLSLMNSGASFLRLYFLIPTTWTLQDGVSGLLKPKLVMFFRTFILYYICREETCCGL